MQTEKYIFLLLVNLLFGCQVDDLEKGRREINKLEDSLDKIILERKEMGFIGNVRSALEYQFDSENWKDETINIKGGK